MKLVQKAAKLVLGAMMNIDVILILAKMVITKLKVLKKEMIMLNVKNAKPLIALLVLQVQLNVHLVRLDIL
jgi:hypothetical protein